MKKSLLALSISGLAVSLLSGCSSDSDSNPIVDNGNGNVTDTANYTTLDASAGAPAYLDLSSGQNVSASDDWHIAYQKYVGFSLNGGVSGEGNIEGCVGLTYPALYDASGNSVETEFANVSPASTSDDFQNLDETACTDFSSDQVDPYIEMGDWLAADYSTGAPVFSASTEITNGWIVKSATADGNELHEYGRVHVAEVNYDSSTSARQVKLAVENWNHGTQTFEDEVVMYDWLDFSSDTAYWDMETNSVVTESDDWELSLQVVGRSWNIHVNSGISGSGLAQIGGVSSESTASAITNPTDTAQIFRFFSDSASSAIADPGGYGPLEYGVFGGHQMTPNFTHYLIKDGEQIYKVQLLNNYGENSDLASGNLYFRYEAL